MDELSRLSQDLDPELSDTERAELVAAGMRLQAARPIPAPAFRGDLRRYLLGQGEAPSVLAARNAKPKAAPAARATGGRAAGARAADRHPSAAIPRSSHRAPSRPAPSTSALRIRIIGLATSGVSLLGISAVGLFGLGPFAA